MRHSYGPDPELLRFLLPIDEMAALHVKRYGMSEDEAMDAFSGGYASPEER